MQAAGQHRRPGAESLVHHEARPEAEGGLQTTSPAVEGAEYFGDYYYYYYCVRQIQAVWLDFCDKRLGGIFEETHSLLE